jgi:hypothetical protein
MIGRKRAIRSGNRKGYQVWGEVHATAEDDLNRRDKNHAANPCRGEGTVGVQKRGGGGLKSTVQKGFEGLMYRCGAGGGGGVGIRSGWRLLKEKRGSKFQHAGLHFKGRRRQTRWRGHRIRNASKESGAPCLNAVSDSIYQAVKERYKKRGTE